MNKRTVPLGLADEVIEEGSHIVFLYKDDDERKRTMARFLQTGLDRQEKVLYLVNDISPDEMRQELGRLGVDAATSQKAFDMMEAHYKQCPGAYFSPDYMLDTVAEYYDGAIRDGFAGARGAGEMSWAAEAGHTKLDALIDYESRLSAILAEHPLTTVCQYDLRLFPGDLIMDILSVHPMAIVRGQLVKNPFYMPPAAFMHAQGH